MARTYREKVEFLEDKEASDWRALERQYREYERSKKNAHDKKRLGMVRAAHGKTLNALLKLHTDHISPTR